MVSALTGEQRKAFVMAQNMIAGLTRAGEFLLFLFFQCGVESDI
jgi:hypothetical protein